MEGIAIIHDQTNNKRYVQIDMDRFGSEYLEDLIDGLVAESRKNDEKISFEEFTVELEKEGLLPK